MIFQRCANNTLFNKCKKTVLKIQIAKVHNRKLIGNREWVGFGVNGRAVYFDLLGYPCPAIRFKENTNELLALREKEKGDWRKLTIDEKKTLYRASFRQTLEEKYAPTGDWKVPIAVVLVCLGASFWMFLAEQLYYVRPLPPSFTEEHRANTVRELLDLKYGHLTGLSSHWDYDKEDWK